MKKTFISILLGIAALMLTGCSDSEVVPPDPPLGDIQLLARMFRSMQSQDYIAAVEQFKKYRMTNGENLMFDNISAALSSNRVVAEAQQMLDKGNLQSALEIIRHGKLANPLNTDIDKAYSKLLFIEELNNAVTGVRNRQYAAEAMAQLDSLTLLLAENPAYAPQLEPIVKAGESRVKSLSAKEERWGRLGLLAAYENAAMHSEKVAEVLRVEYEFERQNNSGNPLPAVVEDEILGRN